MHYKHVWNENKYRQQVMAQGISGAEYDKQYKRVMRLGITTEKSEIQRQAAILATKGNRSAVGMTYNAVRVEKNANAIANPAHFKDLAETFNFMEKFEISNEKFTTGSFNPQKLLESLESYITSTKDGINEYDYQKIYDEAVLYERKKTGANGETLYKERGFDVNDLKELLNTLQQVAKSGKSFKELAFGGDISSEQLGKYIDMYKAYMVDYEQYLMAMYEF